MTVKTTNVIPVGMLLGVIIGAGLGYYKPEWMLAMGFIGELFVNALRIIVLPLIVSTIIVGMASLGDLRKLGRTGLQVLYYFLATSVAAVVIGLILAVVIGPGRGLELTASPVGAPNIGTIGGMLGNLIPADFIRSIATGSFIGLIVFSLVFGSLVSTLGPRARAVVSFFKEVRDVVLKITWLLLYAAPFGVLFLVATSVASGRGSLQEIAPGMGLFVLTLVIGLLLHGLLLVVLGVRYFGNQPVFEFIRNLAPALFTAMGTASSSATLPVTYDCVVDQNQIGHRAGSYVLPLGSVINLNGSALYIIVASVFIAQAYGVDLAWYQLLGLALGASVISIGAAGTPNGAAFMLLMVMGVIGFPNEAMVAGFSLIFVLDWLLDRMRTPINVLGDAVGASVLSESFELKTVRRTGSDRKPDRGRSSDRGRRQDRGRSADRGRGGRPDSRDSRGGRPDRRGSDRRPSDRRDTGRRTESPSSGGQRGRTARPTDSPFAIRAAGDPLLVEAAPSVKPAEENQRGVDRRGPKRDDSQRGDSDSSQRRDGAPQGRERRQSRRKPDENSPRRRSSDRAHTDEPVEAAPEKRERTAERSTGRGRDSRGRSGDSRRQPPRKAPIVAEEHAEIVEEQVETQPRAAERSSRGRLNPATVARELAKVTAQLKSDDSPGETGQAEETPRPEPRKPERQEREPKQAIEPEVSETKETTPAAEESTSGSDAPREPQRRTMRHRRVTRRPAATANRESKEEPATSAPVAEKPVAEKKAAVEEKPIVAEKSTEKSVEEQKPKAESEATSDTRFGRSRSKRRGGSKPAAQAPVGPANEKPAVDVSYSTEQASFGRSKKKRVR